MSDPIRPNDDAQGRHAQSEKGPEVKPEAQPTGLAAFWKELRRRHVVRVAITYAVVAWLIIQIAPSTFEGFGIPDWAFRFVVIMVILGFPIAVLLAWAFELTPEGIKTTKTAKVQNPDSHKDVSHAKKRHWFSLGLAAAVPTLIFGVLAAFFFIQNRSLVSNIESPVSDPVFEVESNDKSIAVLPLENMSPDAENAFFADGVQEEILTNLSKIDELLVIGRTSTLRYRDTTKSLREIGEELGVNYLVEGSVQRAGGQVRVTVQLIDASTEGHLWADNYTERLDDFFGIISSVSKAIAGELRAVLSPQKIIQLERRPTESQEAYDFYLQGLRAVRLQDTWESIELFEQAVAGDPDFFEAWHQLAVFCSITYRSRDFRSSTETLQKARRALAEVKRLAPNPSWHLHDQAVLLYNETNDISGSTELLLRALSEDPNNHEAQGTLAWRYIETGRTAEALPYLEAAIRSEPFGDAIISRLVFCYEKLGMYNKARSLLTRLVDNGDDSGRWTGMLASVDFLQTGDKAAYLLSMDTFGRNAETSAHDKSEIAALQRDYRKVLSHLANTNQQNRSISGFRFGQLYGSTIFQPRLYLLPEELVASLLWSEMGEKERSRLEATKAADRIRAILEKDPIADPRNASNLAVCQALAGEEDQFESTLAEVREKVASPNWDYRRNVETEMRAAIAYLVLGDHDKAIETLEAASKMDGPIFLNRELDLWFIFDRLRGNPRFDALLK